MNKQSKVINFENADSFKRYMLVFEGNDIWRNHYVGKATNCMNLVKQGFDLDFIFIQNDQLWLDFLDYPVKIGLARKECDVTWSRGLATLNGGQHCVTIL